MSRGFATTTKNARFFRNNDVKREQCKASVSINLLGQRNMFFITTKRGAELREERQRVHANLTRLITSDCQSGRLHPFQGFIRGINRCKLNAPTFPFACDLSQNSEIKQPGHTPTYERTNLRTKAISLSASSACLVFYTY